MTCPHCGNAVVDSMKYCPKCGTPTTASSYVPPASPPPASWQLNAQPPPVKRKSNTGKILLILGIIFVVLVSGIGVAIYFGVRTYIRSTRSSTAYALAESTLRASQQVKERVGEIKSLGIPIGTFKEEPDGTGFAAFVMTLEGEKASGSYVVGMDRRNSMWRIQTAVVTLQGGEQITVVDKTKDTRPYDPSNDEPSDTETDVNANENSSATNSNNSNQKSTTISGGVLNGKAISLPKPVYPPTAKSAHASGTVVVDVLVDEEGKVISAKAVSGHPLLQASAVAAAKQARFTPTKLSGKAVKVSGLITYNFVAEP